MGNFRGNYSNNITVRKIDYINRIKELMRRIENSVYYKNFDQVSALCSLNKKEEAEIKFIKGLTGNYHYNAINKIEISDKLIKKLSNFLNNDKVIKQAVLKVNIEFYTSSNYMNQPVSTRKKRVFKKGTKVDFCYHREECDLYVFLFNKKDKFPLTKEEFEWI